MARTIEQRRQDDIALTLIKVGDRVRYTLKDDCGYITRITKYKNRYIMWNGEYRRYFNYHAIQVKLDNGKYIMVSPRNLEVVCQ